MLIHSLIQIDHRLNTLLGPPAPTTAQQRAVWVKKGLPSTPILEPWDPPARIRRTSDGGIALSQNVACFQRGYSPQSVFDQYMDVYSDRFKQDRSSSLRCIAGLAYDFLVVLKSAQQVVAGCMVELRGPLDGSKPQYLYISSLCTHRAHGGRRLAQQLTHGVFTLGALMIEQNSYGNAAWHNAVRNDLYMGLTVRRTPGCDKDQRLVRLYEACGMATRQMDPGIPRFDLKSFTDYSIYNWNLDSSDSLISMWKQVRPGVLYCNEGCILNPSEPGEPMYYEFPPEDLEKVQASGVVHRQHAYLHPPGAVHVSDTEDITFSKQAPATGNGVFCIKTENVKTDQFTIRISVPAYFATSIKRPSNR